MFHPLPEAVVVIETFAPSRRTSTITLPPSDASSNDAPVALSASSSALDACVHGCSSGTKPSQPGRTFTLSSPSSRVAPGVP